MMMLDLPVIGFFVILIASLLLFGEMLVKARGVFGVIGLGLIAVYFSYYLTAENFFWLCLLYLAGILFILLDAKLINHGFAALLGVVMMMAAVAIPAPSLLYGILVGMALLVGLSLSFLFLKVFPARLFWSEMTLTDRLTSEQGYNSINEGYQQLVGKQGVTVTQFRPSGTVNIDEKPYSAITEGKWLKSEVPVIVTAVDGTRIVIKEETDAS
ncbi:MAG TPA: NfeD family protein [Bacillales bacterium]